MGARARTQATRRRVVDTSKPHRGRPSRSQHSVACAPTALRGTIRSPDTPRDGALWHPPADSCGHAAGRCRSATERSQSRACCRAHGVWRRRAGSVRPRRDERGRPTRQPVGHPSRHSVADQRRQSNSGQQGGSTRPAVCARHRDWHSGRIPVAVVVVQRTACVGRHRI